MSVILIAVCLSSPGLAAGSSGVQLTADGSSYVRWLIKTPSGTSLVMSVATTFANAVLGVDGLWVTRVGAESPDIATWLGFQYGETTLHVQAGDLPIDETLRLLGGTKSGPLRITETYVSSGEEIEIVMLSASDGSSSGSFAISSSAPLTMVGETQGPSFLARSYNFTGTANIQASDVYYIRNASLNVNATGRFFGSFLGSSDYGTIKMHVDGPSFSLRNSTYYLLSGTEAGPYSFVIDQDLDGPTVCPDQLDTLMILCLPFSPWAFGASVT